MNNSRFIKYHKVYVFKKSKNLRQISCVAFAIFIALLFAYTTIFANSETFKFSSNNNLATPMANSTDISNNQSELSKKYDENQYQVVGSQTQSTAEANELAQKLSQLPGVSDVTIMQDTRFNQYCQGFIEQPVDWNDSSKGTFKQRFRVGVRDFNSPNIFTVGGYRLEIAKCYLDYYVPEANSNIIYCDYRFFAESRPAGLSDLTVEPWKTCMNSEQASKDFHHLLSTIKPLFSGKFCMNGLSKGGYTTYMQAYYQDINNWTDLDAFFPMSAPLTEGYTDERIYDFYETAGNEFLGKERADEVRQSIYDFWIECYKFKDYKKDGVALKDKIYADTMAYASDVTPDYFKEESKDNAGRWFDKSMNFFEFDIWTRYEGDPSIFSTYENMLNEMSKMTDDEKYDYLYNQIYYDGYQGVNQPDQPYYIQAGIEMGYFKSSFEKIRNLIKSCKEKNINISDVTITTEEEKILNKYETLKEIQVKNFIIDPQLRNKFLNWASKTDLKIARFYGGLDGWYGVGIPSDIYGSNTKEFILKFAGHHLYPELAEEELVNNVKSLYNEWMVKSEPTPTPTPTPVDDGTTAKSNTSATADNTVWPAIIVVLFSLSWVAIRARKAN